MPPVPLLFRQYRLSAIICILLFLAALALLFSLGKTGSFLLINGWHNSRLDLLMPYITYIGSGFIYIPIILLTWAFRRDYIVAIIAGIVLCTLIAQVLKLYVYPDELRPFILEQQGIIIHKVAGEELNTIHSFPSGHTSTAFTMALLLAPLMRRRIWALLLPIAALMVGLSRIYLAQHFLTDVAAGMAIGLLSSWLSLLIYRSAHRLRLRRERRQLS